MSLQHKNTESAFKADVKAEINAGKPQKQAVAIAYQATGKDSAMKAAGIMYRCGDKILLLKRTKDGTWGWPGGGIEGDETAELAARRESLEETGIMPSTLSKIDHTSDEDVDFVTYLSNLGTTVSPQLNDEHSEYMWGDFDNLPDNLHRGVAATIKKFKGEFSMDSAQEVDLNGFITIEANPISRSGIFPYLGKSIDPRAEPDRVYYVYRPEDELNNSETLESMKLIPLVNDHTMIGIKKDGMMAPEEKGIQGSTGENIFFRESVLFATIKIFSQTLADMIKMGKKALSLGYQCKFVKESGIFDGQPYDYVQKFIRGNHLALVDEARCDVAVLDHNMAFDHFDLALSTEGVKTMAKEGENDTKEKDGDQKKPDTAKDTDEHGEMTMQELHDLMKQHMPMLKKMNDMMDKHFGKDEESEEKKDEKADPAMDEPEYKPTTEKDAKTGNGKGVTDAEEKKEEKAMDSKAMDAAISKKVAEGIAALKKSALKEIGMEASKRDDLANQISSFVGTFDASEMSLEETAAYGVKHLGIKCDKGQEMAALNGFMHNRHPSRAQVFTMDGNAGGGKDDLYEKTSQKMYK